MRGGGASGFRIALVLLLLAGVLLGLAQAFLPGIAASTISARVGRYGRVDGVSVKAWPAIELLWGSADSVRLRAGELALTPRQSATLLAEARGASSMDVTAAGVSEGSLHLHEVTLRKRAGQLVGEGSVSAGDVQRALPAGVTVALLGSRGGRVLVRVRGGPFGLGRSIEAVAQAAAGRLVVRPLGVAGDGLGLTLFSDPRIAVGGVAAQLLATRPTGYRLRISARLR